MRPTREQHEEGLVLSASVKVMRLLGAGMVTLAVVPWLGVSPAVATGNGHGDKADKVATAPQSKGEKADKKAEAKSQGEAKSEAKSDKQSKAKSEGKADKAPKGQKADKSDPAGFNGTVKIHDDELEPSPERKNQPKVCDFHVHGFNFDSASSGTYRIEAHKWGGTPVKSGTWTADDSGEWRTEVMTLPDGHYKLFVDQTSPEAPGGFKHKVFKVKCGEETSTSTPSGTTSTTPTETMSTTPTETMSTTPTGSTTTATQTETETVSSTATTTVTETVTVTATPSGGNTVTQTVTTTAPGSTSTVTQPGSTQTVTVTESGSTQTVTTTGPGSTTTVTQPPSTQTVTVTETASPSETGTGSTPGSTVTVTETVTVSPGGVGVLPTKIGNGDDDDEGVGAGGDDTGVLGTKTGSGVLAATGLELPMGAALGLSFALLLAGGALMTVPSRLAAERGRRH